MWCCRASEGVGGGSAGGTRQRVMLFKIRWGLGEMHGFVRVFEGIRGGLSVILLTHQQRKPYFFRD